MIVCSCHGVTDREIREAFGQNGDRRCRAGSACGNCTRTVSEIVSQVRRECSEQGCDKQRAGGSAGLLRRRR